MLTDIPINPVAPAADSIVPAVSPNAEPQVDKPLKQVADSLAAGPEPSAADYDNVFNNPVIQPVLAGEIPAVRFMPDSKLPEVMSLRGHAKAVLAGGLNLYRTKSTGETIVFNPEKVSSEAIQAADAQNKIPETIPPAEELLGGAKPGASEGSPAMPAPQSGGNPLSKLRLDAVAPKTPSERALPGAGILNSLLARPV